jgi:hypothetical protein
MYSTVCVIYFAYYIIFFLFYVRVTLLFVKHKFLWKICKRKCFEEERIKGFYILDIIEQN